MKRIKEKKKQHNYRWKNCEFNSNNNKKLNNKYNVKKAKKKINKMIMYLGINKIIKRSKNILKFKLLIKRLNNRKNLILWNKSKI